MVKKGGWKKAYPRKPAKLPAGYAKKVAELYGGAKPGNETHEECPKNAQNWILRHKPKPT